MKCSDARHLIHLSVGDDNLPDEEQALGEHLHTCSDCRAYNAGMVDAMQVLHDFRDSTVVMSERSVWESVERRIEDRRSLARAAQQPQRQFHGGVAALCACSLVLAFVTIVQNLPVNQESVGVPGLQLPGTMNVSYPTNRGPAMPVAPRFVPVVNPQNGEVVGVQDVATNIFFDNVVKSQMVPVDNGLQNF